MTRILVTGATGFVGKHLVPKLIALRHDVIEVNSQSGDIAAAATWLKFPQAEVLIHLAGKTFVPDSWADPAGFIKCNLLGTIAALDYCKASSARLVFLSSYLYGNPHKLPIPETSPLVANNPYALSKKLAEDACHFYAGKFGVSITILRPFNVYGPGQQDHFLIPSIIRQINTSNAIQVNDLVPRRDYVYISDLVDVIVKAINLQKGISIFNVGSGVSYSVAEVVQIIQELKNTSMPVMSREGRRKSEVMDTVADITLVSQVLGWAPRWTLLEGIRETILNQENGTAKAN